MSTLACLLTCACVCFVSSHPPSDCHTTRSPTCTCAILIHTRCHTTTGGIHSWCVALVCVASHVTFHGASRVYAMLLYVAFACVVYIVVSRCVPCDASQVSPPSSISWHSSIRRINRTRRCRQRIWRCINIGERAHAAERHARVYTGHA